MQRTELLASKVSIMQMTLTPSVCVWGSVLAGCHNLHSLLFCNVSGRCYTARQMASCLIGCCVGQKFSLVSDISVCADALL